jgi:hypothetical protein
MPSDQDFRELESGPIEREGLSKAPPTLIGHSNILPGGHRLMRCTSCRRGAVALEEGGRCRQTAAIAKTRKLDDGTEAIRWSCPGRLHATDAPAKKGEAVCQRQGCGNAPMFTTANGEAVCRRCLAALASTIASPSLRSGKEISLRSIARTSPHCPPQAP